MSFQHTRVSSLSDRRVPREYDSAYAAAQEALASGFESAYCEYYQLCKGRCFFKAVCLLLAFQQETLNFPNGQTELEFYTGNRVTGVLC